MPFIQHSYPLKIVPAPAKSLIAIIALIYTVSALCIFSVNFTSFETSGFFLLLLLSFVRVIRWHYRRIKLFWENDGFWQVHINGRIFEQAILSRGSVHNQYFAWLHLKPEKGRMIAVVLMRDSLSPDSFRRLRVRLALDGAINPNVKC